MAIRKNHKCKLLAWMESRMLALFGRMKIPWRALLKNPHLDGLVISSLRRSLNCSCMLIWVALEQRESESINFIPLNEVQI